MTVSSGVVPRTSTCIRGPGRAPAIRSIASTSALARTSSFCTS